MGYSLKWNEIRFDSHLLSYYNNAMDKEINKKTITDEQIAQWVNEAEQGYDVQALKKRGRGRPGRGAEPGRVITIRVTPQEIEILDQRAAEDKLTRSEFIRRRLFT